LSLPASCRKARRRNKIAGRNFPAEGISTLHR